MFEAKPRNRMHINNKKKCTVLHEKMQSKDRLRYQKRYKKIKFNNSFQIIFIIPRNLKTLKLKYGTSLQI